MIRYEPNRTDRRAPRLRQVGMTLIEILVVLVLIGVVSAPGL